MKRLLKQLAIALAVAAVAVPLARATDYDGYKSGYPQLHTILTYHQPQYDGYKSGYPQLHATLSPDQRRALTAHIRAQRAAWYSGKGAPAAPAAPAQP